MKNSLFFKSSLATLVASGLSVCAQQHKSPNIILIMTDDMGYSDIGCYGGEIPTPNIDYLAKNGIRYTRFYNTGRSCPTRASLLTGLYPHQAGIGGMSEDPGSNKNAEKGDEKPFGYKGFLNHNCVTIAEVLKEAGYHTYMTGKWHLGMHGMDKWPLQRGFEHFYGILSGATNYFRPGGGRGLTLDNSNLPSPQPPYYTTDAFTDHAVRFIDSCKDDQPFFLYLAFNAPHWPLQAKDEDIEKFVGKYETGWEDIRNKRLQRMIELGLVKKEWGMAEWESRKWSDLSEKEKHDMALRMSVYAAQISAVDENVGKLLDCLKEQNRIENTLIVFLSDNGACAEPHNETGSGTVEDINNTNSWNQPSYGLPWAQVSNTPYRKYKIRAYEGGISTPLILSWPAQFSGYNHQIRDNVGFLPDIMATFVDAANAKYPETYHDGQPIFPMEGSSLLPTAANRNVVLHEYIFGEHFNNCYVRWKNWKAVKDEKSSVWELFDMDNDRTERNDLAQTYPEVLKNMTVKWDKWANDHFVYPKK
ncbi:MAG: arylsulfatase [Bacteroidales bacterium]|jgi:arylsulfatase|nr:arylsulfatase [Bacteroidales bacterium]